MDGIRLSASEILIPASEIQGNPRPKSVGQWVPHEDRPWWTEDALKGRRGLKPDLTTGTFVEPTSEGWRFRVLNDGERAALFLVRSGRR